MSRTPDTRWSDLLYYAAIPPHYPLACSAARCVNKGYFRLCYPGRGAAEEEAECLCVICVVFARRVDRQGINVDGLSVAENTNLRFLQNSKEPSNQAMRLEENKIYAPHVHVVRGVLYQPQGQVSQPELSTATLVTGLRRVAKEISGRNMSKIGHLAEAIIFLRRNDPPKIGPGGGDVRRHLRRVTHVRYRAYDNAAVSNIL